MRTQRADRRDVNDATAAARAHDFRSVIGAEIRSTHVGCQLVVQQVFVHIEQAASREVGSIVDQQINAFERLGSSIEESPDIIGPAQIAVEG